jgi:glutamate-ammonia-ligase adenylyltransferase
MFLIGVRVLSGTIGARRAGEAFARLAAVLVGALLDAVLAELARAHGRIPGGKAVVVAMGKLGGREMTASSDLDLILLYDHDADAAQSDGPRPLAPSHYYARLTQRLVAALTAPTAEGKLYDVDIRLRPSGNAGPLATRIDAFERYQETDAWTWEHMALTRARVIAGDGDLAARAEAAFRAAVARPREAGSLMDDVADMRARIEAEKGSADPFELKTVPGGLIDVEFVAQALQLAHGAAHPALIATNTEAALAAAAEAGILSPGDAEVLVPAIRLYHDLTQVIRLAIDGPFRPAEAPRGVVQLVVRAGAAPTVESLKARLEETEASVREVFERIVGPVRRRA